MYETGRRDRYLGPLFRVDEPVPYDSCNNSYEETKLTECCDKTFVQLCIISNNKSRSARYGRMTSCASYTPVRRRRFILGRGWWSGASAEGLPLSGRILTGVPSTDDRNGSGRSLPTGTSGRTITMPTSSARDGLRVIAMATRMSFIISGRDRTRHLPN